MLGSMLQQIAARTSSKNAIGEAVGKEEWSLVSGVDGYDGGEAEQVICIACDCPIPG